MITVKRLKAILETLPDDAPCVAYEGGDIGIKMGDHYLWILASDTETEDAQEDFPFESRQQADNDSGLYWWCGETFKTKKEAEDAMRKHLEDG